MDSVETPVIELDTDTAHVVSRKTSSLNPRSIARSGTRRLSVHEDLSDSLKGLDKLRSSFDKSGSFKEERSRKAKDATQTPEIENFLRLTSFDANDF